MAEAVPGAMPNGIAVIDKPAGWTSHDVVAKARGILGTRKVGHSGTLDPDATGVLVLGVGRATRLLRYLTALPKSYEAEIVLGVETDTLDASGQVTARHDMAEVTVEQAREAATQLTGEILQIPPMVSAVKVGGRRLHALARAGVEVEREPRPVTVYRFDVETAPADGVPAVPASARAEAAPAAPVPASGASARAEAAPAAPVSASGASARAEAAPAAPVSGGTAIGVAPGVTVLRVAVDCSSGTYVRVLAADLGRLLRGGAHLRGLRRTAVGGFGLDSARPLESVELLPMAHAVKHLTRVQAGREMAAAVAHGRVLEIQQLAAAGVTSRAATGTVASNTREAGVEAEPGVEAEAGVEADAGVEAVSGVEADPGVAADAEAATDAAGNGPWAVHDSEGELLAVYERHERFETRAKPSVVVAAR